MKHMCQWKECIPLKSNKRQPTSCTLRNNRTVCLWICYRYLHYVYSFELKALFSDNLNSFMTGASLVARTSSTVSSLDPNFHLTIRGEATQIPKKRRILIHKYLYSEVKFIPNMNVFASNKHFQSWSLCIKVVLCWVKHFAEGNYLGFHLGLQSPPLQSLTVTCVLYLRP